jgi:catechol 2,3-dioxygenase-like lactoylglutathione lyase family enzyme
MPHERAEPILPSRDLAETRTFYERLGFRAWWPDPHGSEYQILSRGDLVVHFYSDRDLSPARNASMCYWRVPDADAMHAQLAAAANLPQEGIPRLTPPADQPWGMRECALVDPSGNLVRIGHELAPRATGPSPEADREGQHP